MTAKWSYSISFLLEARVDSFEKASEFGNITIRYQLDAAAVFDHIQSLARPQIQGISDGFRYNYLKF